VKETFAEYFNQKEHRVELPSAEDWRRLVKAACGLFELDKSLAVRKRQSLRRSCFDRPRAPDAEHILCGEVIASLHRLAPHLSSEERVKAQMALELLEAGRRSPSLSKMNVIETALALHELQSAVVRAERRRAGKQSLGPKSSPEKTRRASWLQAEAKKIPEWMMDEPKIKRAQWLNDRAGGLRWPTPQALLQFARRYQITI
jgi:hypothetical protein